MSDEDTVEILHGIKTGDCWCPVGIGNPMMKSHTDGCRRAQAVFALARRNILDRMAQAEVAEGLYDKIGPSNE